MVDEARAPATRQLPSGLRLRRLSGPGAVTADCAGVTALFVREGGLRLQVDGTAVPPGHAWLGRARQVTALAALAETAAPDSLDALLIDTPGCARFDGEPSFGDARLCRIDAESAVAMARIVALWPQSDAASVLGCHFEAMRLLTLPADGGNARPAPDARVLRAAAILRTRMHNPPGIEALAREIGLSPAALKRAFPAAFGCPPYAWLRRERLIEARRLIEQTALPIADIAHRVGLAAGGHFAAACRDLFGKEPRALREAVQDLDGAAQNTGRMPRHE